MRLIHTTELYIQTFSFDTPEYAILSHRWSSNADDEVSYQDFVKGDKREAASFQKILHFCDLAAVAGLQWAWIDTACIDKTSSAELSESINSMFKYYEQAKFCCVFFTRQDFQFLQETRLDFVHTWTSAAGSKHYDEYATADHAYSQSWFGRGWTLQELLAPVDVRFYVTYDGKPHFIGTKLDLSPALTPITGIPKRFLTNKRDFREATVASRMSWAAKRTTSRPEDMAYCLLGLFDANMPLLYGEGRKAYQRLQEAILLQCDDDSIFAWTSQDREDERGVLAISPAEFGKHRCVQHAFGPSYRPPCSLSSKGIELHVAMDSWSKLFTKTFSGSVFLAYFFGPSPEATEIVVPLHCGCRCDIIDAGQQGLGQKVAIVLERIQPAGESNWDSTKTRGRWIRKRPYELMECEDGVTPRLMTYYCGYIPIFCSRQHSSGTPLLPATRFTETQWSETLTPVLQCITVVSFVFPFYCIWKGVTLDYFYSDGPDYFSAGQWTHLGQIAILLVGYMASRRSTLYLIVLLSWVLMNYLDPIVGFLLFYVFVIYITLGVTGRIDIPGNHQQRRPRD